MTANHKRKNTHAALELRHRAQIVGGLRDSGLDYGRIARLLGISLSKVEKVLGEAAALRTHGLTKAEIAAVIGVPRGSVGRLLPPSPSTTITARQSQVLAVLSQMRGMQVDLIADFLDVELSTAYDIVGLLVQNGSLYPLTRVQQGKAWAYPKVGVPQRYLGWRPKDWAPSLMYANHDRAVAQARIMLVGSDPQRWVSERQLYRRAEEIAAATRSPAEFSTGREPRAGRPHIHDGWVLRRVNGELQWWAVEVELTRKGPQHMDTALQGAMRAARDTPPFQQVTELVGLLYLCRTASVMDGVYAATDRLPPEIAAIDLVFEARDLDDDWSDFLARRDARRQAAKAKRRTTLRIAKDAS